MEQFAEAFLDAIKAVPNGWAFLGASLAVIAIQVVVASVAGSRRHRVRADQHAVGSGGESGLSSKGTFRLVAVAGASILTVLVMAGSSVHQARATMVMGLHGNDPGGRARLVSAGISGQLNAMCLAIVVVPIAVSLWFLGLKFAVEGRRSAFRPSLWPILVLPILGLVAISVGALRWSTHLIHAFASLDGVPPEAKARLLLRDLNFAREHFAIFVSMWRWTIGGMAVTAFALTILGLRRRDAWATPAASSRFVRIATCTSVVALALAGALVFAARSMKAENELPWPPLTEGDPLQVVDPPTPDLIGPDIVTRAPVIMVFTDRIALDGIKRSLASLSDVLWTLRNNASFLNPGVAFNGNALIVADSATEIPRLASVLKEVSDAGYSKPLFVFTKAETLVRPSFGALHRVRATGVRVGLVDTADAEYAADEAADERIVIRPEDFQRYDELARRLVALRQAGKIVSLNLGK